MNNGYASKHFHLERVVRQDCSLSGTLLAQSIRRSKELKGIAIDKHNELKLSQYADDTTVLLSDVQSASKLFDLLSLFERCSGLKLNQTNSEMLWFGCMRHRKDTILDIQMSGEPVYALGVHFTYDLEVSEKNGLLTNWDL